MCAYVVFRPENVMLEKKNKVVIIKISMKNMKTVG